MIFDFRYVRCYVEVYLDGKFIVSADTISEAHKELKKMGYE